MQEEIDLTQSQPAVRIVKQEYHGDFAHMGPSREVGELERERIRRYVPPRPLCSVPNHSVAR